jgi:DNA-binding FadR family transcriptional regulator
MGVTREGPHLREALQRLRRAGVSLARLDDPSTTLSVWEEAYKILKKNWQIDQGRGMSILTVWELQSLEAFAKTRIQAHRAS